jgi:hypothetical protein
MRTFCWTISNEFDFPDYMKYSQYYSGYSAPWPPMPASPPEIMNRARTGLNRRDMNIVEDFFASLIPNWKIGHRIQFPPVRRVPVTGGECFRPRHSWPGHQMYTGLMESAPGRPPPGP